MQRRPDPAKSRGRADRASGARPACDSEPAPSLLPPHPSPDIAALPATRRTLLARLRGGGNGGPHGQAGAAWRAFAADYEAGLLRFARSKGLQEADARDAVQETLLAVHAALSADDAGRPTFDAAGTFRGWLTRVAFHKCIDAVRRRAARHKLGAPAGGTAALGALAELADDAGSGSSGDPGDPGDWRRWAFCVAAGRVEAEVEATTWAAFVGTAVDGRPAAEVGAELGLSVGAVYAAKCRTLAKLRAVAATLSEEDAPDHAHARDDRVVGSGGKNDE